MEIRIDIDTRLYNNLKKDADHYNMTVEEFIETVLEEQHG